MTTTTKKINGDGLDIPAALRRVKGETPALPAKPTAAKPAATKPLTAKQAAQQRAGVKVTADKKAPAPVEAPAPAPAPAPAKTPEAKLAEGKAQIKAAQAAKAAKSAKPVGELLKAVKAHAKHFAHKNGWDLLLKWSDADISKELVGLTSKTAAVEKMRKVAQGLNKQRPKDQPAPARAS
jgi:hypothetical protein